MTGNKIKEARQALGISQTELAERLGYKDRSTIAKIEAGVNDVSQKKLAAIAEALGVQPVDLLDFPESYPTGNKKPVPQEEDGLDNRLIAQLKALTPAEAQRVYDFVLGLIAARSEGSSPSQ